MGRVRGRRWRAALGVAVGLVCAAIGLGRGARADEPPPAEAFDPALDLPDLANFGGRSADSRDGVCSGAIELAMAWREARRADPTLPRLAEALAAIEQNGGGPSGGGTARVRQLLATAQDVSAKTWRDGVSMSVPHPENPDAMSRAIEATVALGETPRLLLLPPAGKGTESVTGGNHTVAVYGTRRVGDTIELLLADNTYAATDPRAKTVRLVAQRSPDGRSVQWVEKVGGDGGAPGTSRVWGTAMLHERPPSDPSKLRTLVTSALEGRTDVEARSAIGFGIDGPIGGTDAGGGGGASAVKDPKAGGVWVSFDPGSFDGERDEASLAAFTDALRRVGAGEASGAVVLPPAARREALVLVPLSSLVVPTATTVGALTRVRGYVKTTAGALYVVGVVEPGAEPIDLDVLVVALRAVWRDGTVPFVSLDPPPGDPLGDPVVRLGGVPEDAKDSAFLRILLAADYRMKEILLGSRAVQDPDVRSLASLLKERNPPVREVANRFWLAPLSAIGADVLETRRGDATAVWFQSRSQVLTEQMLEGPTGIGGTGESDPLAREAAERMTAAWARLWPEVPVFRRAGTAFDCAKLCTLLRLRGERAPVLAELAGREIAHGRAGPKDEPAPPFRAVGPLEVEGTPHLVFGGARAKARVRQAGIVRTDRLAGLLDAAEAAGGGAAQPVTVELPVAVDVDAAAAQAVTAELSLSGAQACLAAGDRTGALARLDVAVAADPDDTEMRYWRAIVRMLLDRDADAIEDLARAADVDPRARALRAFLHARAGARVAAEADLAALGNERGLEAGVRSMEVLARLELGDAAGADGAMRLLRALAPFETRTQTLEVHVRRARRMSPEEAARERRWRKELPAAIQRGFERGDALRVKQPEQAVAAWGETLLALDATTAPAVEELEVREKLRLLIVYVGSTAAVKPDLDPERRVALARMIRTLADGSAASHPERPMPRLLQAVAASAAADADPVEVGRFLGEAVARNGAPDPFLKDMGEVLDTESPLEVLGFSIAVRLWDAGKDARPVIEALLPLLGARAPGASLRALLEFPRFNLATWEGSLDARSREGGQEATDAGLAALRAADAAFPETPLKGGMAVWFAPMLYKGLVLGEQSSGDKARMKVVALKFLRISTVPAVPSLLREAYAEQRARFVPLVMGETFRAAFDGAGERMETPGKRLTEAVKAKDAAAIQAAMPAVTAGVNELRTRIRTEAGKALAQLESACGPRIAAVAELFVHLTQAQLARNMDKPAKDLDELRAVPGVAGTKELVDFEAAFRGMATGLMIDGTPQAAFERVRTPPKDEMEALTLLRLVPVMRDLLRGMFGADDPAPGGIDLGRLEAELKLRIAGGAFGPATGGPAGGPAAAAAPTGPRGGSLPPPPPTSSGPSPAPRGALPWMWIVGGLAAVGALVVASRRR